MKVLRSQLKRTGVRIGALDKAIAGVSGDNGSGRPKQANILIEIAKSAELFHTADRVGYADININGHRETYRIRHNSPLTKSALDTSGLV